VVHSFQFSVPLAIAASRIPGLLFKSGMENIGACDGTGHSSPVAVTIETVITATEMITTEKSLTASPVRHARISYVLEHRRPEPRGFTDNWSRIPISGCLQ
jgi:hypothetical protein